MTMTNDWVTANGLDPALMELGRELDWALAPESERYIPLDRFCGAPTKPGYPCRNWKTKGTDRCYLHPELASE